MKRNVPPVHVQLSQEDVKHLGLHLDSRLTWHKHIFANWKHLGITLPKCTGYLDASQNSPQATNFSYKTTASTSNQKPCA
jgi:hypothetical protein